MGGRLGTMVFLFGGIYYCWWKKSCTTWDVKNPINNGINYQPQLVTAGFLNHQQYGKNIFFLSWRSRLVDEVEKIYPSIKVYPPEVSQFAPEKWPFHPIGSRIVFQPSIFQGRTVAPLKINMEHNHGGLVHIIFLSKWVICRFHVNLPGCKLQGVYPFFGNRQPPWFRCSIFRQYTSVPGCYDVSAWIFEVRFVPKEQRITCTVEVSSDQLTMVNCCIEGIKNYPVIWGL